MVEDALAASTSRITLEASPVGTIPPRLPLEIIEQIIEELALPCIYGDPKASSALAALACTNRTLRESALHARHAVAVAPRHVRDFRRWIRRVQDAMPGRTRALFVALDDVSKLTSMSAGWDVELLKLLQRLGPHLTHLSLWTSETTAILRDPAQVRGPRVRRTTTAEAPVMTTRDVVEINARRRQSVARTLRRLDRGTLVQGDDLSAVPLKARRTADERQTKAEIAAARERARQTMPNWLRNEMQAAEQDEVKRRYKAHLSAIAREYQHERDAANDERRGREAGHDRAIGENVGEGTHATNGLHLDSSSDEESEDEDNAADLAADWACMPLRLSLCPSLPLHEHEEPLNFARMTVFARVEELDIFVAVPSEVPRILVLFACLVASPLRKLRISSIYATLMIVVMDSKPPGWRRHRRYEQREPGCNLAGGLTRVLKSSTLRSRLFNEFAGRHGGEIDKLEGVIADILSSCDDTAVIADAEAPREKRQGLADSLCLPSSAGGHVLLNDNVASLEADTEGSTRARVSVKILQGDQKHTGKLKDRRQDFLTRALDLGPDYWEAHDLQ